MKKVMKYETSDGNSFTEYKDAKRHAEKRYGDLLTKLAHRYVQIDKYTDMLEALNTSIGEFRALIELRDDCRMESENMFLSEDEADD